MTKDDWLKLLDKTHFEVASSCGKQWVNSAILLVARMNKETAYHVIYNEKFKNKFEYGYDLHPTQFTTKFKYWPKNTIKTPDGLEVWINGYKNTTTLVVVDNSIEYGKLLISPWDAGIGRYFPISI